MATLTVPVAGIDIASTVGPLLALPRDPTVRLVPGRFERATQTPDGPGTIVVTWEPGGTRARVETHGDGGTWLAERAPGLLGCLDDPGGFEPAGQPLRDLWRRHAGDRICRTSTLWHDLAWFVVQQRVDRASAAAQWQRLVTALGTPAPGVPDLLVPPDEATVGRLAHHRLHGFGIERQRADNLVAAARAVRSLTRFVDGDAAAASAALRSVRGIGPWTTSCLATHTWGDADTVVVGDARIPSMVAWLLAREQRADDARLLELLEPHRPHRHRVVRLTFLSGLRPPRRAPHGRPHDIRRR